MMSRAQIDAVRPSGAYALEKRPVLKLEFVFYFLNGTRGDPKVDVSRKDRARFKGIPYEEFELFYRALLKSGKICPKQHF
jgi:hypothetical protein